MHINDGFIYYLFDSTKCSVLKRMMRSVSLSLRAEDDLEAKREVEPQQVITGEPTTFVSGHDLTDLYVFG